MDERVYKIARASEWEETGQTGRFTGSPDDKRDGYIHLSTAAQVRATCNRYFSGENNLLLVILETSRLGPALKWETSRAGQDFPHLYAALPAAWVHSVIPIGRRDDGRPIFPPEIA
jgi:uncharacterized protein (DUF952 family)